MCVFPLFDSIQLHKSYCLLHYPVLFYFMLCFPTPSYHTLSSTPLLRMTPLYPFLCLHPPLPTLSASNSTEILKEIPVDLVQKDDILKVLPGARIPTDGYILTGSAFIDESMITGESLPTLHVQGDAVFGSTVNQQSTIYIKATAVGSEVCSG